MTSRVTDAPRRMRPVHADRAFTLIEIMVVVTLIAIIVGASIPSLYGMMHKEGLRKTVSDIMETCQSARAEAILKGSKVDLVFHPVEGTCEASSSGGGGYGAWAHSARFENCSIEMLDINLVEFKDAEMARVRFFPDGTSDELMLVLRSDKNEYRTIKLEITTALPSVSTGITP